MEFLKMLFDEVTTQKQINDAFISALITSLVVFTIVSLVVKNIILKKQSVDMYRLKILPNKQIEQNTILVGQLFVESHRENMSEDDIRVIVSQMSDNVIWLLSQLLNSSGKSGRYNSPDRIKQICYIIQKEAMFRLNNR